MRIIDVVKSYNEYTYDQILDAYSKTNEKDLLFYCQVKRNKWEISDLIDILKIPYEDVFLKIYNIQRILDGNYEIYSFDEMYGDISSILGE